MNKTIMVVYGTRPEAIKVAPLIHLLKKSVDMQPYVVVTGQHREMLDQVNGFFEISPHIDLDLMSHGSSVTSIASRVMSEMERVLNTVVPDAVVVQGDTTSALAASLASFFASVPVIHLEAGLRTGDLGSPFPEEANRRLTAVVSKLHLAPTVSSRRNLEREGVDPAAISVTGNTVVDALEWTVGRSVAFSDKRLSDLDPARRLILVTTHRRESWGAPMVSAMRGLRAVLERHPDLQVVLPLHRNQIVRDAVEGALGALSNVILTEPLPYPEFAHLMKRSYVILTDSGGVQEEAPSLGKPVLVLRDTTERPEGVTAGTVKLVGTASSRVQEELERLTTDQAAYDEMANAVNPYGDGRAAARAVEAIRSALIGGPMPEEFSAGALV